MEAAIAWLVQTILATLLIDKLDAWIRQVGLADEVQKLKSEIRRIKIVVSTVKERGIGNELLAEPLALLQDHIYEADDVVDELDYYRLQQQVQGGTPTASHTQWLPADPSLLAASNFSVQGDTRNDVVDELDYYRLQQQVQGVTADDTLGLPAAAEQVVDTLRGNSDVPRDDTLSTRGVKKRKRRSKAWENFDVFEEDQEGKPLKAACKHCLARVKCAAKDGTSGMLNHNKVCQKKPGGNDQPPNPSSAGDATETATPSVIADSSGRERRREDEESAQITVANTYTPWDKAELSNRIQKITSQLQDIRGEVSEVLKLYGSDSASSSNNHPSIASDQHLKTSSLVPRQVYGRVAEKDSIKNLILEDRSDGVRVLPIVGIAGVGKTALAQFVYNDPEVEDQFPHRIWVWVSRNFDEVSLTREMLDFVSQEKHEGISSFAKLQEILRSHANSKKFLLIFDDVWDDMKDCRWEKLLAPFGSGQSKGIVILVTTRNLSVAKRLGTLKPVKLDALKNDDFWLLFKSHAFGGGNYEVPRNLNTIGQKIAEELKGNPLAAVSIGALLREDLTVDHWSNILKKEYWNSLGLTQGLMPALKLSYDQLPYHLQKCFSYCSIFPDKHKFFGKDLVYIWISQGFVSTCLTKRLEETGWKYLTELVNLGFFQQVEEEKEDEEESFLGSHNWYSICGLMHDFARIVSRNYCATIDGLLCTKMLRTIQHLSVVTDSAYSKDCLGYIPRNTMFEEKLKNTIISVRKLRTLVLIGKYDSHFFQVFQDKFRTAHDLRFLQVFATSADFNSFVCSLVEPTHLRYVKHKSDGLDGALPLVLNKFFHLQVLDVGSNSNPVVPDGMHNLVSLRHLVVDKGVYSSISSIGNMTSLQELHEFNVQFRSSGFEMKQLQSMNELVQLGLSQLDSVKTREEAYGAGLRDKVHLEELHLSWKDSFSDKEHVSDTSSTYSEELFPMDTAREVLEGLEPHMELKHLHISRYTGTSPTWLASNISVTSLQTLHLDGCGGWRILPSLESSLPFLMKLKLSRMWKVTEVLVPSLEKLVLISMPKLVRCSSTSVESLNSSLRVLQIKDCEALKEFDLFENNDEFDIEQMSWLPGLRKLDVSDCPHFKVLKPLPHSTTVSELRFLRVSTLPYMEGSSSENLCVGFFSKYGERDFDESSDELRILDDKILAFHNLRNLKSMSIGGCQNLTSISFKGFSHLVSLKSLEIGMCKKLFSSDVIPDDTHEDVSAANCKAFSSLEWLSIWSCGITGKWLSLLLRHAPDLQELHLEEEIEEGYDSSREQDDALTGLTQDRLVQIPLSCMSSLRKITVQNCPFLTFNWSEEGLYEFTSLQELNIGACHEQFSSLVHRDRNDDRANGRCLLPASLEEFELSYSVKTLQLCFPSDLTNLRKLMVHDCPSLESIQLWSCIPLEELKIQECESLKTLKGLQSLSSLRHLAVFNCPRLVQKYGNDEQENGRWLLPKSLWELDIHGCSQETLQPWFPSDVFSLKKLKLLDNQGLKSLQLHSCTAMEDLTIGNCGSLTTLEGLQSLGGLRHLTLFYCPGLSPWLERFSRQGYKLCSRLETLHIDDPSLLTTSVCERLTSLRRLKLGSLVLTDEQQRALVLIKYLQELEFYCCSDLMDLPVGLHLLPSLKRLKIDSCRGILRLPETGLPLSLEELDICLCSEELADQCRALATSKLYVKIGYCPY